MLEAVFLLIILFQFKQYLADFCFQSTYMLQKKRGDWSFFMPLVYHCLVHAIGTFLICLYFRPDMWFLAILDFILHFLMDRIRAAPRYLGRFNDPEQAAFWWIFGFDQMFHQLTHVLIIWLLLH